MAFISVLSYNIHKGFKLGNQTFVLKSIKQAVESVGADLVFLQEVLGDHTQVEIEDWPSNSQFEYLADRIWPHYAYGKNAVYSRGHHGNAILSKYPLVHWENIDISQNQFASRGMLHAEIDVKGQPLHAICLHFDLRKSDRDGQVEILSQRVQEKVPDTEPLIIAGDFNDWTAAASKQLSANLDLKEAFREHRGRHARTFPAQAPTLMLDRIYYRSARLSSASRMDGKPWNALSDHLALLAQFELPSGSHSSSSSQLSSK